MTVAKPRSRYGRIWSSIAKGDPARCGPPPMLVTPFAAAMSRKHEFEADAYASAQANGQDLANALVKLHEDNAGTLTPDPLYARFYYSHPPAAERLAALKTA